MLLAERVSHLLQVLLVVICLSQLSQARYGHSEPVFGSFVPLQFLEQLDVLFALRVDLARLYQYAGVENGIAYVVPLGASRMLILLVNHHFRFSNSLVCKYSTVRHFDELVDALTVVACLHVSVRKWLIG